MGEGRAATKSVALRVFVLVIHNSEGTSKLDIRAADSAGAVVRVRYPGERRTLRFTQEVQATSDELGNFTLPVVAQGKPFVLDALAVDRPMSSPGLLTAEANTLENVQVRLPTGGQAVSGRVTQLAGQAAAGQRVQLRADASAADYTPEQRASLTFSLMVNRATVTGSDGRFRFSGVPPGKVSVLVGTGRDRVRREVYVASAPVETNLVLPVLTEASR